MISKLYSPTPSEPFTHTPVNLQAQTHRGRTQCTTKEENEEGRRKKGEGRKKEEEGKERRGRRKEEGGRKTQEAINTPNISSNNAKGDSSLKICEEEKTHDVC